MCLDQHEGAVQLIEQAKELLNVTDSAAEVHAKTVCGHAFAYYFDTSRLLILLCFAITLDWINSRRIPMSTASPGSSKYTPVYVKV